MSFHCFYKRYHGNIWRFTFRTSSRDAETPGFVGIISLTANTADKLGGRCVNWSSFGVCSKVDKDGGWVRLCADDIAGGQLDKSLGNSDDEVDDVVTLFDAFFANVLNAAAKEDAFWEWLASTSFNEGELVAATVLIGNGVSQLLELECCSLTEGILKAGREHFMREDGAIEGIVGWSFVEFPHVDESVHSDEYKKRVMRFNISKVNMSHLNNMVIFRLNCNQFSFPIIGLHVVVRYQY